MTHAELQSNVISVNVGQHVHIIITSPMQELANKEVWLLAVLASACFLFK